MAPRRAGTSTRRGHIRPAHASELGQLAKLALRSKAAWGYSSRFMRACADELGPRRERLGDVFVKVVDRTIVGFYSLENPRPERRSIELGHLFVEPSLMRRGYGRDLLDDAQDRSRARGFAVLVIQGDPHAARFYEARGAVQVGERESESVPGRMLPLFELVLDDGSAPSDRT